MASRSSTTEDDNSSPQTVVVGRIRRPHGVSGGVLVQPLSDIPGRLDPGSRLLLVARDGSRQPVEVCWAERHRQGLVVHFEGWHGRDRVEPLRGATLEIEDTRVPEAEKGSYYYYQLLGCRCRDRRAGDLGQVVDLVEDGGGLLLCVASQQKGELLIPFVENFICKIDVDRGRIELELPPGLVEACVSRL